MRVLFNVSMAKAEGRCGGSTVQTVDVEFLILGDPLSVYEGISTEQALVLQL
jgi:hypothetical protein